MELTNYKIKRNGKKKMDTKNVIAAIAISSTVIVLWSLFFIPEQQTINQDLVEKEKI